MLYMLKSVVKASTKRVTFILIALIMIISCLFVTEFPDTVSAMDNGLALTPPMGWNSWNIFAGNIDEAKIKQIADTMVSSGMRDAGYIYLNLDDNWMANPARDADGNLMADPVRFPSGMKALADYVHSKGLKLGIYGDRGTMTCMGIPQSGSHGYEVRDANTFASWGIDYLKYDNCNSDADAHADYERMRDALANCGRPIVFSICAWSYQDWMPNTGNLWRIGNDIKDVWDGGNNWYNGIVNCITDNAYLSGNAGPGGWNDTDMLEIGNGGCTDEEYRTQMSMWSIMAAPLIAGNDIRTMTQATKDILLNNEVIAVDQDAAGLQGFRVKSSNGLEVWCKPLGTDGTTKAVALFNSSEAAADITVHWTDIGLLGPVTVRDLWEHADKGSFDSSYTASVPAHGVVILKVAGGTPYINGAFKIVNRNSGKVLAVQNSLSEDNAAIVQVPFSGASNEKWQITPNGDGTYKVININSSKCMTVQNASTADGANILQNTYNSNESDKWRLQSVGNGYYNFVNSNSGKMLNIPNTLDGAQLNQLAGDGSYNQQFQLIQLPAPTTYYRIRSAWTKDYMHIENKTGKVEYGALNRSWLSMQWFLEDVGDGSGTKRIKNAGTGDYLNIEGAPGYVEYSPLNTAAWSMMWIVENVGNGNVRFKCRWPEHQDFMHIENKTGYVQSGPTQSSWLSAQWILEPVADTADTAPQNSSLSPTTAGFDKKVSDQADISVTMSLNGNMLCAIKNGTAVLSEGTDYTVSGSAITIKKNYLATLPAGQTTSLKFYFSAGDNAALDITVSVTTPSTTPPAPPTGTGESTYQPAPKTVDQRIVDDTTKAIKDVISDSSGSEDTKEMNDIILKIIDDAITKLATKKLASTANDNGRADAIVDYQTMNDIVDNAGIVSKTVESIKKNIDNTSVNAKIQKKTVVEISADPAISELNTQIRSEMFSKIAQKGIDSVVISSPLAAIAVAPDFIKMADSNNISFSTKRTTENNKLVVDLKLSSTGENGQPGTISSLNKGIAILIPYTLKPGEDKDNLAVFCIAPDGTKSNMAGKYADGYVIFKAGHFGKFMITHNQVHFTDISDHWSENYVNAMAAKGLIAGKGNGLFDPNGKITKAEFVTLMANLLGVVDSTATTTTKDVSKSDWFFKYIASAAKAGIIDEADKFNPNAPITREEMAVIISKVLKNMYKETVPSNVQKILDKFEDQKVISDKARDAIATCVQYKVMNGNGSNFDSAGTSTRGETATILYKLFNY